MSIFSFKQGDRTVLIQVDDKEWSDFWTPKECCVCLETKKHQQCLSCDHFLCLKCLMKIEKPECPLCRATISAGWIDGDLREILIEHWQSVQEKKVEEQIQADYEYAAQLLETSPYVTFNPTRIENLLTTMLQPTYLERFLVEQVRQDLARGIDGDLDSDDSSQLDHDDTTVMTDSDQVDQTTSSQTGPGPALQTGPATDNTSFSDLDEVD